jgi:chromate transporter
VTTPPEDPTTRVGVATVAWEWLRIGCIGFGGPPAHVNLLRQLCVDRRRWLSAVEFEDGVATTNLLPGPASTQMAIFCAWRVCGTVGAVVGGLAFILPGLLLILGLAVLFLQGAPPTWVQGAAAGAGAVVAAVAVHAGAGLIPASLDRMSTTRMRRFRWTLYVVSGFVAAGTLGAFLVVVLLACGLVEVAVRRTPTIASGEARPGLLVAPLLPAVAASGLAAVAWVGLKVGALSYGGGFVIIPLMQRDAVETYGWLTDAQFLNAVALGQLTPGPVTHTVAVVGYGAAGMTGALVASLAAFAPSFVFVLAGGRHFSRLRANPTVQGFFSGAGPAAVGAIVGSAVPLALALAHPWQVVLLAAAAIWLLVVRRARGGVMLPLLCSAALGVAAAFAGLPV